MKKQFLLIFIAVLVLSVGIATLSACGNESAVSEAPAAAEETEAPSPTPAAEEAETPAPATPEPTPYLGCEIADFAKQFEGWKYVYGCESPEDGFDCSGLIYYVYRQFGYRLNRVAKDQNTDGDKISSMEELLPGDIVLFSYGGQINHCGIYLGDDKFIHAMDKENGVVITSLSEWAAPRRLYMRRIVGSDMPRYTQEEVEALDEADREYNEWLRSQPTPTPTPAGPRPGTSDTPETPYVPTPTPAPPPDPEPEDPGPEEQTEQTAPDSSQSGETPE